MGPSGPTAGISAVPSSEARGLGGVQQAPLPHPLHHYDDQDPEYIEPYPEPPPDDEVPYLAAGLMEAVKVQVGHLNKYAGIRFNRILGAGGFGAAILYDIIEKNSPWAKKQVVLKIQTDLNVVHRERSWHHVSARPAARA